MRILELARADEHSEAGALPDPELMARMGAFIPDSEEEAQKEKRRKRPACYS